MRSFPTLEDLTLTSMLSLAELTISDKGETFPRLCKLRIIKCPNLVKLPFLQTLKMLKVRDSNALILKSVANLSSITSLYIFDISDLMDLPEGLFRNLLLLEKLNVQ